MSGHECPFPESCPGILVVEDHPGIADMIRSMFEMGGHRVLAARNGKEALEILRADRSPCFVLLDLMMPEMSGHEFLEIRSKSRNLLAIPVVAMSASETTRPSGADAFLRKPFELDSLFRIVESLCNAEKVVPHRKAG